jgi:membrane protease YdiL (CAAX protease family)
LLLIFGLVFSVALAIPLAVFQFVSGQNFADAVLALSTLVSLPAVTLATWIARKGLDRRSFRSLGLELTAGWRRDLLAGFAIPIPLFGLIYLVELGAGWLDFQSWGWAERGVLTTGVGVLLLLLAFVAVGFYEELLFRGYYLQNLRDGINPMIAVFATSAAFGLAHLGNLNASWTSTLGIFAAGLFLAYAWLRTRALWLPIGIHIGWNFLQGPVFGFEVSGNPTPSLVRHVVNGPELITGGAFGPEAGLIVLPAMAVGAGLIWWYTRHRVTASSLPSGAGQG